MKLIISQNEVYPYFRIYQTGDEIPTSLGPRIIDIPSEKVEWMPEWQRIVKQLKAVHGEAATVMVFPCSRVQFDPSKAPLVL